MAKEKTEAQKQLEAEVKKNLRRIKRFVKSAEKRGYSFSEKAIPKLPKTITQKTLSYYQSIRPEKLYKKAVYVSPEGTKIKGFERRAQERSQAAKKAAKTRKEYFNYVNEAYSDYQQVTVSEEPESEEDRSLQRLIDMFENWSPQSNWSEELTKLKTRDRNRGYGIITGSIERLGRKQVAINAKEYTIELIYLADKILYESGNTYREDSRNGEINLALGRLYAILNGKSLTIAESLQVTEISETNEVF